MVKTKNMEQSKDERNKRSSFSFYLEVFSMARQEKEPLEHKQPHKVEARKLDDGKEESLKEERLRKKEAIKKSTIGGF